MNASPRLLAATFLLVAAFSLTALEFSAETSVTARSEAASSSPSADSVFLELSAGLLHEAEGFRVAWELGFSTEGLYPAPFMGDFFGPFAVEILEAGISYRKGPLGLSLGKLENRDVVDSPYSLFVSGENRKAMLAEISFEDEKLFFSDRWIGLNRNLESGLYNSSVVSNGYSDRDRGAVIKSYGLKFGRLRFGFQDAVVFTGDYFDLDFFANPAPGFFVQYVATAAGRPWSRSGNQNSLMGFFADYAADEWTAYAQILVDDFNMNRFLNPDDFQNPDKLAFSLGGSWDSPIGKLGAYLAGATRYTFESIGEEFYSYTYYPGSAVYSDGSLVGIPLAEQMLGYSQGENNLSFMTTWAEELFGFGLGASLELKLSGEKSPANPWHEEDWDGTRWLDDPVLEKWASLGFSASKRLGSFVLSLGGKVGWVQNRLTLVIPAEGVDAENREPLWRPSSESGLIGELILSGRFSFEP